TLHLKRKFLNLSKKLGHSGNMNSLSDAKVETLPQPWRTFGTIINKCLSGKVTGNDLLRLYRAQILWEYGAILPDTLTNQAMKESDTYKTYYDLATGKVIPKPKYVRRSTREKTDQAPKASPEGFDKRFYTPFHFESTDDEAYDEVTQGDNVVEEKLDEEKINEEKEVNKLYNDMNIHLEGRDTEMMDALLANVQATQMLNPNPDICFDSILNLNIESTFLVVVLVTTNDEIPPSSITTLPSPPILLIHPVQQTPVSTQTIVPSASLQNFPTFGSLFKFKDRVKSLEDDFLEFKQTNLFVEDVSSILGIVDKYLAKHMNEAVKAAIQLQLDRLREEAHAKSKDFINKIDENIKKIIKEQVKVQVKEQVFKILPRIKKSVNEQLEAEVLTRSSNEAKTSHVVAANQSELKLKKILIDKMEINNSIHRLAHQKTLYKALIDAYETNKVIRETHRDTITFKRRRDDEDEDKEPSAGSNPGSKRRRFGKE
nr:hypothetical protein [Tanacetum cinerariifolium]